MASGFCWLVLACLACTQAAFLSNTKLPVDTNGNELLTGELDVLTHNGTFYFYFNDWGYCGGVDCCASSGGCASCCFNPPSKAYPDSCVYTNNHTIVGYKTVDWQQWVPLGPVLKTRLPGIEFRPHVVFNKATNLFVMWYEDRHPGQEGYAVATSKSPEGPFVTVNNSVPLAGSGRVGDFDVFVDDDGSAYHVRTGFVVEKLNDNFTAGTGEIGSFSTPKPAEGPVFFKRDGVYYILAGTGCCACLGGSTIYVFTAPHPLGPFTFQGDVGSNPSPFDPHSPNNYVTRAQASSVVRVPGGSDADEFVWIGNQWVTSKLPGRPRNNDLLYWSVLDFDAQGRIKQLEWRDNTTVSVQPQRFME